MVNQREGGGRPAIDADERLAATMDKSNDVVESGLATQNQLWKMFGVDKNQIGRRLSGLAPVRKKNGFPLYNIREAAGMLVSPGYEIEDYIKRMNKADLPPGVGNDFWAGQTARLRFEEANGDLWRTADVEAVFAETLKEARMVFTLLQDNVESETSLTPQQRDIIRRLAEGGINGLKERLCQINVGTPVDNIAEDAL